YKTSDNVWLTKSIPMDYLAFKPWVPVNLENSNALEELKREIGERTSHFLFRQLNNLKLIWKSLAADDTLFLNQHTGECFMVLLTYTKSKQEASGWPHIEK